MPEDFAEGMHLTLSDVEDGSATSVLERPQARAYEKYNDYYEAGRVDVEQTLEHLHEYLVVSPEDRSKADVSGFYLLDEPAFLNLGASMPLGSKFEILTPSLKDGIEVSSELREMVMLPFAERRQTISDPPKPARRVEKGGEIAGHIIKVNADTRSFSMVTAKYGGIQVRGTYKKDSLTADIRQLLERKEHGPLARVKGTLHFEGERLERLDNVTEVQLLETGKNPWSNRFFTLAALGAGWEDADAQAGAPIAFPALDAAGQILLECESIDRVLPGIFPLTDGGVQLEWATSQRVTSIEISPDVRFTLFDLLTETNQVEEEETASLQDAKDFAARTKE
ncbi:hypothetical protein [Sinomonas atrocyanea]|uniref:hypothetical protein n=1 Tax=Sinomonas atrocyanea TaxID=37927 RepID=UPI001141D2FB|nr:hypothetical protein [Sinomonas atrocyanea]